MKKNIMIIIMLIGIMFLQACSNNKPNNSDELYSDNELDNYGGEISFDESILEDFLSEFLTIFDSTLGWKNLETSIFYVNINTSPEDWFNPIMVPVDELPLVSLGGTGRSGGESGFHITQFPLDGFFNQDGELITEAPFVIPFGPYFSPALATSFRLFDFDNDGVPEIVVGFRPSSVAFRHWYILFNLYRFIDGEFRLIHTFENFPTFWFDAEDILIVEFTSNNHDFWPYFNYLNFVDDGVEIELMYDTGKYESFEEIDAALAEMRESLTPFPHLTELYERMTKNVKQRLGLTQE